MTQKPLVNTKYQLQKFPGKGGWTYVVIDKIPSETKRKFGFVRVKGLIDDYAINSYNLMPMKSGTMFLPIKAAIRKHLKKKEGDWIKVTLYADNDPIHIPGELLECLRDEPGAYEKFHRLTESQQKQYIDHIYAAKQDTTRAARIASVINELLAR